MHVGLQNLSLKKPSLELMRDFVQNCQLKGVNHLIAGASEDYEHSDSANSSSQLTDGWFEDYNVAKVGQGRACFDAAKAALQSWQHMSLGWVGTNKPEIRVGSGVCIIAKMLCFWQRNPLQIVYVNERKRRFWQQSAVKQLSRQEDLAFEFGQTTLEGHALAGEERFRISLRKDDSVWYEIYAFSRARTLLAIAAFPLRRFYQKKFRTDSVRQMRKLINLQQQ